MTGDELDDYAADRLLDGAPGGPATLSRLLSAASAPGHPSELAGELDALAVFRAVRSAAPTAAQPRYVATPEPAPVFTGRGRPIRHHGRRSTWPRKVSVRLAVVGASLVAVAAAGGVAVAAGVVPAAVVPAPLRHLVPNATEDSPDRGRPGQTAGGPSSANGHSPEPGTGGPAAGTSPTPTPANLNGLCHSFQDAAAVNLPSALSEPRFAVLVQLAGGRDQVVSYCDKIVEHPAGKPETSASPAAPAAQGRQ